MFGITIIEAYLESGEEAKNDRVNDLCVAHLIEDIDLSMIDCHIEDTTSN